MNSKLKIAVCISGDLRFFDITSLVYQYWIDSYTNIEFDFYVTSWNYNYKLEEYQFIKDYKILKSINGQDVESIKQRELKYSYSLFQCHELRRQSRIKYDYVIQTRSDIVLKRSTLNFIFNTLISGIPQNCIMIPGTTNIVRGKGGIHHHLCDDNYSIADTLSMNKFSMMYYDAFVNKEHSDKTSGFHQIQLEQARFRRLVIYSFPSQKKYIREKPMHNKAFEYKKLKENPSKLFNWIEI